MRWLGWEGAPRGWGLRLFTFLEVGGFEVGVGGRGGAFATRKGRLKGERRRGRGGHFYLAFVVSSRVGEEAEVM